MGSGVVTPFPSQGGVQCFCPKPENLFGIKGGHTSSLAFKELPNANRPVSNGFLGDHQLIGGRVQTCGCLVTDKEHEPPPSELATFQLLPEMDEIGVTKSFRNGICGHFGGLGVAGAAINIVLRLVTNTKAAKPVRTGSTKPFRPSSLA